MSTNIVLNFTEHDKNNSINIEKLTILNIIKNQEYKVLIDLNNNEKQLKKYIRKIIKLRKRLVHNNTKFLISNYNENNHIHREFISLLDTIMLVDKKQIYNKAYDLGCDYLDSQFYGKNLCDFHNDKCGYKKDYDIKIGCCRHYEKHKQLGLILNEKLVKCRYLANDGHCTIKCMGCKLFTCDYLKNKGISFKIKDIFALDCVFNIIQKIVLKSRVYTPKEEILNKIWFKI